ncbi:MAG: type IV-A pilus assembly ATPase PilB [Nitrospiraceae bacterium]|nr:type IV-A pilus assembly ATPase PilB [Nitrospiraceae bacterium]
MAMSGRLGAMLVSSSLITDEQLKKALATQKTEGGRLGSILVKLGFVQEEKLMTFLSKQYGVPYVDLSKFQINPAVVKHIPPDVAQKYRIMPINRAGATITIAMVDPSNIFAIDDIKFMTGYNVEAVVATEGAIVEAIKKYYGGAKSLVAAKGGTVAPSAGAGAPSAVKEEKKLTLDAKDYSMEGMKEDDNEDILDQAGVVDVEDFDNLVHGAVEDLEVVEETQEQMSGEVDAPIVKLVNGILLRAAKMGVSDIHIEPYEKSFRVRYRLDGSLHTVMGLPLKIKNAVISRIKIMSMLDIAERRLPQDGRIKMKMGGKKTMDFRVSVLPCLFGEKVVMRLLDKSNLQLDMTKLGFGVNQLKDFKEALDKPYGMVLVTGPTGSGKTTTLYSALSELNKEDTNIMTAEDPVEFNLAGINQVQMKDDIGLNFAAALRSFLRQDPDVIMVGEIRDYETAEIGVKAALTGHLVLSTLHTNDAPSTINRLLNMGVEPFLVSSAVVLILAQRLVRKVCQNCKQPEKLPPQVLIDAGFSKEDAAALVPMRGKGCDVCNSSGYKGRVALYEVMPIKDEIKELILQGASVMDIKKQATASGMQTLRMSGLAKIKEGMTTLDEVLETTFADIQ